MNRTTVADELLLDAQPQEVKDAIQRVYADAETLEDHWIRAQHDAFAIARQNIREWFRGNDDPDTCTVSQEKIDSLVGYIDT
jgi:hypothetical protein